MILMLGHRKRVGKDTIAKAVFKYANETLNWTCFHVGFAVHLKEECYRLFKNYGFPPVEEIEARKEEFLPKLKMTVRDVLIKHGQAMKQFDPNYWANVIRDQIVEHHRDASGVSLFVISDFRFPQEYEVLAPFDPVTIKVVRPGFESKSDVVDDALKDWQFHHTFVNDCSREEDVGKKFIDEFEDYFVEDKFAEERHTRFLTAIQKHVEGE